MQNINYEQMIAVLGMCIWFIFPFGMFISAMRQDSEALPPPGLHSKNDENKPLKIFEHKKMIYNDEEIGDYDYNYNKEERFSLDDEFNHPHVGIGSTHIHHVQ